MENWRELINRDEFCSYQGAWLFCCYYINYPLVNFFLSEVRPKENQSYLMGDQNMISSYLILKTIGTNVSKRRT